MSSLDFEDYDDQIGGYGVPGQGLGNQNARGKGPYQQGQRSQRQRGQQGRQRSRGRQGSREQSFGQQSRQRSRGQSFGQQSRQQRSLQQRNRFEGDFQDGGYGVPGQGEGRRLSDQHRQAISEGLRGNQNARGTGPYQRGQQGRQGSRRQTRRGSTTGRMRRTTGRRGSISGKNGRARGRRSSRQSDFDDFE